MTHLSIPVLIAMIVAWPFLKLYDWAKRALGVSAVMYGGLGIVLLAAVLLGWI